MSYVIRATPTNISTLNTYNATGFVPTSINDGTTKSLGSFSSKPILLAFINAPTAAGRAWLQRLGTLASADYTVFVVMFKYVAGAYATCSDLADVRPAIVAAGGHAAFATIPVVIDATGAVSTNFASGLFGAATPYDHWSCIIDPAYLICDKWHSDSKCDENAPPVYPISFKHLSPRAIPILTEAFPITPKPTSWSVWQTSLRPLGY